MSLFCLAGLLPKYVSAQNISQKDTIKYTFESVSARKGSKTAELSFSVTLLGINENMPKKDAPEYQRGSGRNSHFERKIINGRMEYRSTDMYIYPELRPLLKYFNISKAEDLKGKSFTSRYGDAQPAVKDLRLRIRQKSKEAPPAKDAAYETLAQALSRMKLPDFSDMDIDGVQAAFDAVHSCGLSLSGQPDAQTQQWEKWLRNRILKLNKNIRLTYAKGDELPMAISSCGGDARVRGFKSGFRLCNQYSSRNPDGI